MLEISVCCNDGIKMVLHWLGLGSWDVQDTCMSWSSLDTVAVDL